MTRSPASSADDAPAQDRLLVRRINDDTRILVLVEGRDDKRILEKLLKVEGKEYAQVEEAGGVDNIPALLKQIPDVLDGELDHLVIVRDADKDPDEALGKVQRSIQDVPALADRFQEPLGSWETTKDRGLKLSILLIPGKDKKGALETLLLDSVSSDPTYPCVEEFMRCLEKLGQQPKRPKKSKARAYAEARVFLATRDHPYKSIGDAVQENYWNLDHEAFSELRDFLRSL